MISNLEKFQELNQTRQHETRGQQLDMFQPTIPQGTTDEYWFFSDMYNLFGETIFPTNQAMEKTVHKRIYYPYGEKPTIQQSFDFCTGHYDCIHRAYKLGYRNFNHANDLKLTRYACWSFLQGKPHTIFAQTYFLSPVIQPGMDFATLNKLSSEYARVSLRERISVAEKILAGILRSKYGNHREFYNSTSLALFNGKTYSDIKEIHHIPNKDGDTLLNYMGAHTLSARMTALYRAFDRYNKLTNPTIMQLDEILCDELYNQRAEMINRTGMRPENNISTTNINQVQQDLKLNQKKFISQYATKRIR